MNDNDLRDCFAMFAMTGLLMNGKYSEAEAAQYAFVIADTMLEARKPKEKDDEEDTGIASVAKRTYKRKG